MTMTDTREAIEASGEEFLEHFGVKGMKWGVRNDSRGPKLPASADKVVADAAKAKAKRSGTSALSNKELRDAAERARLEQEYDRLVNGPTGNAGKKIAKEILLNVVKRQATAVANDLAQDQIKKAMKK